MTNESHQYHLLEQDIKDVAWGNIDSDWSPPSSFPDLTNYDRIAIDLETRDPNLTTKGPGWCRKDGYIIGVAVAAGDSSWYFPIKHETGNLPRSSVMAWLKKQMATPNIEKVMHNALYDLGWLRAEGIEVQGKVIDTMVAAPLLNENRRWYNLDSLARDYLNERKNEKMLRSAAGEFGVDPKKDMWRLPSRYVGQYAEQDAAVTLRLWERFRTDLAKEECTSIFELEVSLIPVLLDMKSAGVKIDLDRAEQVKKDLKQREDRLLKEIKVETGIFVEPWAATSIAKAFDALGLTYQRTEKTNAPAFTKSFFWRITLTRWRKRLYDFVNLTKPTQHLSKLFLSIRITVVFIVIFTLFVQMKGAQLPDDFLRPTRTSSKSQQETLKSRK